MSFFSFLYNYYCTADNMILSSSFYLWNFYISLRNCIDCCTFPFCCYNFFKSARNLFNYSSRDDTSLFDFVNSSSKVFFYWVNVMILDIFVFLSISNCSCWLFSLFSNNWRVDWPTCLLLFFSFYNSSYNLLTLLSI